MTQETASVSKDDWITKPTTELFGIAKRKPANNKLIEGYTSTLVRSDVFELIKELQKQQTPRLGAKELVTAILGVALKQPETLSTALRQARQAMAEELHKQAAQFEQE